MGQFKKSALEVNVPHGISTEYETRQPLWLALDLYGYP